MIGGVRRFPYVGDPSMPLGEEHIAAVGLVVRGGGTPIGTGFVVLKDNEQAPAEQHPYFVTAKHVLKDEEGLAVRFRRRDGSIEEEEIPKWFHHKDCDVSVAPLPDRPTYQRRAYALPVETRVCRMGDDPSPALGSPVFYAGLFDPAKKLSELGIPIARSGTLAAWSVPVERRNEPVHDIGHLIDCRSYGGFSGSPCWTQFAYPGPLAAGEYDPLPGWLTRSEFERKGLGSMYFLTPLIGMLTDHYSDERPGSVLASKMGIGVVLPIDFILEALNDRDLIKQRSRELERRHPDGEVTRQPLSAEQHENTEIDEFTDLTRRLLNVRKDELDAKLRETKDQG